MTGGLLFVRTCTIFDGDDIGKGEGIQHPGAAALRGQVREHHVQDRTRTAANGSGAISAD